MVDVARILWKFVVGVKDLLALIFLIVFFVALFAVLSASPNPAAVRDGVLRLDLNGVIAEQPAQVDPLQSFMSGTPPVMQYRQRDIIRALDLAKTDDRVKAVVLDLDGFLGGGQVSLAAIGGRLDAVKKAGKPVYAYATGYMNGGYQLASHASQIWLNPLGGVLLTGPGGSRSYYKGLLDKSGIKAHVYRVGTYKSAVEPYLRSDQSPEAKEALSAVYDEYWESTLSEIKKARPKAKLDALLADPASAVEAAKGDLAKIAIENGLVDRAADHVTFGKFLAEKYGAPNDRSDDEIRAHDYASFDMKALLASHYKDNEGDPIAVITAAGPIVDGRAGAGTAGSKTVSNLIYKAIADDEVKAILLRVDSPGGSVTASEEIRLALEAAKKKKLPVVVSMANMAASGGYWISTPADAIFAQPGTITGSIGIFGVMPSAEDALAKLGITSDGVKTTALSGEPDPFAGVSPEFHRVAQSVVEKGYNDFLSRVSAARSKSIDEVNAVAQGRIWAGGTARQLGLVDRTGDMDAALAHAAKLAKLKDGKWHARYFDLKPDFLTEILANANSTKANSAAPIDIFAHAAIKREQSLARLWGDLSMLMSVRGAQVYCMECSAFLAASPAVQDDITVWSKALSLFGD